ncbi:hypothetical protein PP427_gp089 [Salmonella phage KM16]|nr:hypothetical protein PP427_gp089 [Salmonella phage KM16]
MVVSLMKLVTSWTDGTKVKTGKIPDGQSANKFAIEILI